MRFGFFTLILVTLSVKVWDSIREKKSFNKLYFIELFRFILRKLILKMNFIMKSWEEEKKRII